MFTIPDLPEPIPPRHLNLLEGLRSNGSRRVQGNAVTRGTMYCTVPTRTLLVTRQKERSGIAELLDQSKTDETAGEHEQTRYTCFYILLQPSST